MGLLLLEFRIGFIGVNIEFIRAKQFMGHKCFEYIEVDIRQIIDTKYRKNIITLTDY